MLFIAAGMGGGAGTGAAPVIAQIARDLGILTVAVVTKPFDFEGPERMSNAQEGINNLEQWVDSLIVIPNSKLKEVYGGSESIFSSSRTLMMFKRSCERYNRDNYYTRVYECGLC